MEIAALHIWTASLYKNKLPTLFRQNFYVLEIGLKENSDLNQLMAQQGRGDYTKVSAQKFRFSCGYRYREAHAIRRFRID